MTLENYYLHAIEPYGERNPFDIELALNKLEEVVSSGYILSRRQRGDNKKSIGGWNGIDYISLCDYSKRNNPPYNNDERFKDYTAYTNYIKDSISLIISKKNIMAITPELKPPVACDFNRLKEMVTLGNHPTKRFSDYPDEVQVKDKISLKKIIGVTVPIDKLIDERCNYVYSKEEILRFLKDIKEILNYYHKKDSIYDLLTMTEIKGESDLEKVFTKLKDIN